MQEFLASPAWGVGLATVTGAGQVLDAWYPAGQLDLGELPAQPPEPPAGA
ncbi:MAG TPA: 2,3,4,5-tetrahydropyridine-2,6-dicarboxylate N-succinyltransferase, partial [Rugosimonospora sp.]|nr:2,3,4,5-tetrahydropyridine-2,6-dicarboxylate N-succinyltransferase [Rugosimonospora sp.]